MPTDIAELLEPWLDLPISGKTYRITVDAETGLWCTRMLTLTASMRAGVEVSEADAASLHLDDEEEQEFTARMLGDTHGEMLADKVPWEYLKLAARVVFTWAISNRVEALALWERGGLPEAPAAPAELPKTEAP